MSNETSARVEGESGMEQNTRRCKVKSDDDFWWFCSLPQEHSGSHRAYEFHDLAMGLLKEWPSNIATEPKVGESGLSDEEVHSTKKDKCPCERDEPWDCAIHHRVNTESMKVESAALPEAKPEPLPNTLDVERAENWLKANHDVLRYAQKTPTVRVLAEVLHDYSLTVVAAPSTLQEERIEALLQVVREYRDPMNGYGRHVLCVVRTAGLMHGTKIDDRCAICKRAEELLAAPKVVDSKEEICRHCHKTFDSHPDPGLNCYPEGTFSTRWEPIVDLRPKVEDSKGEPHCEHGIAWRLCSMHPGSWIGPNNEDAGEEQDGEQESPQGWPPDGEFVEVAHEIINGGEISPITKDFLGRESRPLTEAEKEGLKPFIETRKADIALHYGSFHETKMALKSQIEICNELRERLRQTEQKLVALQAESVAPPSLPKQEDFRSAKQKMREDWQPNPVEWMTTIRTLLFNLGMKEEMTNWGGNFDGWGAAFEWIKHHVKRSQAITLTPSGQSWEHSFKNFHRSLCERFGYIHDEKDWFRDQVSLEEYIWAELKSAAAPVALPMHQIVETTTQAAGYASLRCSCGRIFIGLSGEARARSRASFEAHLPEKEGK